MIQAHHQENTDEAHVPKPLTHELITELALYADDRRISRASTGVSVTRDVPDQLESIGR
jgi:hypothetical protein